MNKKAFTLMEVLVLVIVAAVLLFVAIPSFDKVADNNDYNRMHALLIAAGVSSMNFHVDNGNKVYGQVINGMTIPANCQTVLGAGTLSPGMLVKCGQMQKADWESDNYDLYVCPYDNSASDSDCDDSYAYIKIKATGNQDLCPLAQFSHDQELVYPANEPCNLGF